MPPTFLAQYVKRASPMDTVGAVGSMAARVRKTAAPAAEALPSISSATGRGQILSMGGLAKQRAGEAVSSARNGASEFLGNNKGKVIGTGVGMTAAGAGMQMAAKPVSAPPASSQTGGGTGGVGNTNPNGDAAPASTGMLSKYMANLKSGDPMTLAVTAGIPVAGLALYKLLNRKKKERPIDQTKMSHDTAQVRAMRKIAHDKVAAHIHRNTVNLFADAADCLSVNVRGYEKVANEIRRTNSVQRGIMNGFALCSPKAMAKLAHLLTTAAYGLATKRANDMASMAMGGTGGGMGGMGMGGATNSPDAMGGGLDAGGDMGAASALGAMGGMDDVGGGMTAMPQAQPQAPQPIAQPPQQAPQQPLQSPQIPQTGPQSFNGSMGGAGQFMGQMGMA